MISSKTEISDYLKTVKPLRLNLACGQLKIDDAVGIDISEDTIADVKYDLTQYPWPIEDGNVESIFCAHYVEHLPHAVNFEENALFKFMNECGRILRTGGELRIVSPYYTSIRAYQDPTHQRFISEAMFCYFSKAWREANGLKHYPITCNFEATYGFDYEEDVKNRSDEYLKFAIRHYWNIAKDIHVSLIKQ